MEKKFTKGNWGFGENYTSNNGTHVVYSTNNSYPTQNTYIATTLSAFNSEADAKLMAAAPELLEACEWALKQFEVLNDKGLYPTHLLSVNGGDGLMTIIKAINKATK